MLQKPETYFLTSSFFAAAAGAGVATTPDAATGVTGAAFAAAFAAISAITSSTFFDLPSLMIAIGSTLAGFHREDGDFRVLAVAFSIELDMAAGAIVGIFATSAGIWPDRSSRLFSSLHQDAGAIIEEWCVDFRFAIFALNAS